MGKKFQLGDLLCVTHGVLMSPKGMDGVYDILNYMTGESLFTHQLPRANDACKPYLLKQFPCLAKADCEGVNATNFKWRLARLVDDFGDEFEVEPLPKGAYYHVDPITEAAAMMGPKKVIIVAVDPPKEN